MTWIRSLLVGFSVGATIAALHLGDPAYVPFITLALSAFLLTFILSPP